MYFVIILQQNCVWSANEHPTLLSLSLAKRRGDLLSFFYKKCDNEILSSTCIKQAEPHENDRMTTVINAVRNAGVHMLAS